MVGGDYGGYYYNNNNNKWLFFYFGYMLVPVFASNSFNKLSIRSGVCFGEIFFGVTGVLGRDGEKL